MKRKNFLNSSLFYIVVFVAIIGLAQIFASNSAPASTDNISTTEFVGYLEEDRVEKYSIQPVGGIYEINGTFREGQEIEQIRHIRLDESRAGARHQCDELRHAVRLRRLSHQHSGYPRTSGLLRGYLPHAGGRGQRRDAHRQR